MSSRKYTIIIGCMIALFSLSAHALYSGLSGFSDAFLRDYNSAEKTVNSSKSALPFVALQQRYTNEMEQAELEVSLGLVFGQRTGMVNPSNAVVHFTAALRYDLPEKTYLEVILWRGNSQEQLGKIDEALKDYLRGLLACTYYDLAGGWPQISESKVPLYENPNPEERESARDYRMYRRHLDFQQFLLRQRYFLIDAVKRVRQGKSDREILEILETLSPDSSRFGTIVDWLKSENKRPWP